MAAAIANGIDFLSDLCTGKSSKLGGVDEGGLQASRAYFRWPSAQILLAPIRPITFQMNDVYHSIVLVQRTITVGFLLNAVLRLRAHRYVGVAV